MGGGLFLFDPKTSNINDNITETNSELNNINNNIDTTNENLDTIISQIENTSSTPAPLTSLEKKNYLFDPKYVITQGSNFSGSVGFNTVFGINEQSLPSVTSGLIKDSPVSLEISFPSVADYIGIASTSSDDSEFGIGARAIYVEGLDEFYDRISETLIINGSTPVFTSNKFFRLNRVFTALHGNNTALSIQGMTNQCSPNIGTIYFGQKDSFTSAIPSIIYSTIQPDVGFSRQAILSVPRNYFPTLDSVTTSPGGGRSVKYCILYSLGYGAGKIQTFTWYGYQQMTSFNFRIGATYYTGGDLIVTALADGGGIPGQVILEIGLVRNDVVAEDSESEVGL